MNKWILPCNTSVYNVPVHFENTSTMYWKGVSKTKVDDLVYIYLSRPYSEIRFLCRVTEVNVDYSIVDHLEYAPLLKPTKKRNNIIRLELVRTFRNKQLSYRQLKQHGLVSVQSQMALSDELIDYLDAQRIGE